MLLSISIIHCVSPCAVDHDLLIGTVYWGLNLLRNELFANQFLYTSVDYEWTVKKDDTRRTMCLMEMMNLLFNHISADIFPRRQSKIPWTSLWLCMVVVVVVVVVVVHSAWLGKEHGIFVGLETHSKRCETVWFSGFHSGQTVQPIWSTTAL